MPRARSRMRSWLRRVRRIAGRRRPTPTTGGRRREYSRALEQPALAKHVERQRLVADLVEQHDDGLVVGALDHALAPLLVSDPYADLERPVAARRLAAAGLAVVALAARRGERLAEVREHELAPAAVGLGVAAHHVHARAVEHAPLLRLHG